MNPFEDLIHALGVEMGISLKVDQHQSCKMHFPEKNVSIQIDLDASADQILIGSELGEIMPGTYRTKIFTQALIVNGMTETPRGFLAFSEKKHSLVLFQFLHLAYLTGSELFKFVQLFAEHARVWKEAMTRGDVPQIEERGLSGSTKLFGLTR